MLRHDSFANIANRTKVGAPLRASNRSLSLKQLFYFSVFFEYWSFLLQRTGFKTFYSKLILQWTEVFYFLFFSRCAIKQLTASIIPSLRFFWLNNYFLPLSMSVVKPEIIFGAVSTRQVETDRIIQSKLTQITYQK